MIDTHSHIFEPEFSEDLPEVVARAKEVGVEKIFMPNIDDTTIDAMLDVCRRYPDYCYPMLGFHPTSVDADALPKVREMKKLLVAMKQLIMLGLSVQFITSNFSSSESSRGVSCGLEFTRISYLSYISFVLISMLW